VLNLQWSPPPERRGNSKRETMNHRHHRTCIHFCSKEAQPTSKSIIPINRNNILHLRLAEDGELLGLVLQPEIQNMQQSPLHTLVASSSAFNTGNEETGLSACELRRLDLWMDSKTGFCNLQSLFGSMPTPAIGLLLSSVTI